jgi:hypothetical protein
MRVFASSSILQYAISFLLAPAILSAAFPVTPQGLFSALVYDPLTVIQPAAPGAGSSYKDLSIGKSTRAEVLSALGAPTRDQGSIEEWAGTADCQRFALESITARYSDANVLDQLMLRLKTPLALSTVVAKLGLSRLSETRRDGAQEIRLYQSVGIGIGVQEGQVVRLWLLRASAAGSAIDANAAASVTRPDPAQARPARGNRQIAVQQVFVESNVDWKGQAAIKISATVRVRNMPERTARLQVHLRDARGQWIQAQTGTPSEFRDQTGVVATATEIIRSADDIWKPSVFLAHSAMASRPVQGQLFAISVEGQCDGLVATGEIETTTGSTQPERPPLSVRVLDVRASTEAPDPRYFSLSADPLASAPGRPPRPGVRVAATIEAGGLSGYGLTADLTLRRADGSWVRATPAAAASLSSTDGRFSASITPQAILENMYIPDLGGAIPLDALDLPAGNHQLILVYTIKAGPLRGMAESDIAFVK